MAWQRYLATLLGSHSEATAAVLGIFLGGLSLGYWLFGRLTRTLVDRATAANRPANLLLAYGGLELCIGLYVLAFPWLFRGAQMLSYSVPLGSSNTFFLFDVFLATLLLGPPSVMMGGTIPMLTQALSRSLADATRLHAYVYAFNTLGAFVGALFAGFYLIPRAGLESTMVEMGFVNVGAGLVFGVLGLRKRDVVSLARTAPPPEGPNAAGPEPLHPYAFVAMLTGFAMMCVQTILIRIAVISFGSSQFTFSMTVAVFVLSIALGSLAVSIAPRIPRAAIVVNQWGVALLLGLLYLRVEEAPYRVHVLRTLFRDSDLGFVGFQLLSLLAMLAVIGLPVALSGASLPLLFHHTRARVDHLGDLAGHLYSWNTLGSLLGALLGGYALLHWLDLEQIYLLALTALALAATIVTVRVYSFRPLAYVVLAPIVAALWLLPPWDVGLLHAGLSREREARPNLLEGARRYLQPFGGRFEPKVLVHDDDPATSLVVRDLKYPGGERARNIFTDGKSDGDTRSDYPASALLAALPAVMAERAERAFLLGLGPGITAGELGALDSMRDVQVAEISRAVIEAAPLFDPWTMEASKNPKIHRIQSDAYRALMRSEGEFDLIVTSPSQLWVTGVEMLYSREFLAAVRDRLTPGGVYCQYLQRYETDEASLALVLRTTADVFEHTAVWHSTKLLFVLGFRTDRFAQDLYRLEARAGRPDLRAALERAKIPGFPELLAHEVLPLDVLGVADLPGPLHSLYHPRLNSLAARAAFRGGYADLPFTGFGEAAQVGADNSLLRRYAERFGGRLPDELRARVIQEACIVFPSGCVAQLAEWTSQDPDSPALSKLLRELPETAPPIPPRDELEQLARLFSDTAQGVADPRTAEALTVAFRTHYHHAAPFSASALLGSWAACRENPAGDEACRALSLSGASSAIPTVPGFDSENAHCFAAPGQVCGEGLRRARALLDEGVPVARGRPRD